MIENGETSYMLSNVLQAMGRNAVKGRERFFDLPQYWIFHAQKAFILVKSLERIKATGLVYYLMEQIGETRMKTAVKVAMEQVEEMENSDGDGAKEKGLRFRLSDSI